MKVKLDPRPYAIAARLSGIGKIFAVSGFKGGVGKSSVACLLSIAATDCGLKTGLLDLDFSGASCHLILGANLGPEAAFPEEFEGLRPPEIHGIKLMSLAFFTHNRAVHLRGVAATDAVTELLAVTNWGNLDILFMDMPPGISDVALDVMRLIVDDSFAEDKINPEHSACQIYRTREFIRHDGRLYCLEAMALWAWNRERTR